MSAVRLGLRRFALRPFETGLAKTIFGWNRFWLKPVFVETGFDCRETGFELKPVLIETGFGMALGSGFSVWSWLDRMLKKIQLFKFQKPMEKY